jgi:hypothetical protein
MNIFASLFLLFLAVTTIGCQSGSWVEGGTLLTEAICNPDFNKAMKDPEIAGAISTTARNICGNAGKTFAGDTRCENGSGQVKCK